MEIAYCINSGMFEKDLLKRREFIEDRRGGLM
jgi:hypothetical protein